MGGGGMEGVGGHGDRHDEYSIFVGELTDEVTDGTLLAYFRMSYPNCKTAKVVTGNDGRSKGYGFVRFYDKAEQLDAITRMHGAVGCGGKILRVREATPKNPRRDGGGGMGGHSQWGGGNQWGGQQQQWGGQQWGQQDPYNQWNQQQAYGWGDYQQGQAGQVQDQTGMQAGSGVAVITPAELTPAMEETLDFTGKYNVKEANEIYLKKETKLLMSNLDAWELPVGQRQAAM
ncbi:hypothetical protein SARC_05866 [Sphaeroforma arctica JP610]|uniref:RRM domain-containing protein n=1 Tax=Sphaeroforma arctica JP610 TaxID=667725 RepID=A0A0L0FYX2_9EUKA|nr:hypothetical protein SARC_05866 [Sphaeroforma arctica JP610]KNC81829.1 hypothetical protein SARC_05866 [Sphaeroforma arctica JP610]|eukprot:XP_014155731.1 hypothetical protein SARC_05866 [Sphaeroforma arctica JP610]